MEPVSLFNHIHHNLCLSLQVIPAREKFVAGDRDVKYFKEFFFIKYESFQNKIFIRYEILYYNTITELREE